MQSDLSRSLVVLKQDTTLIAVIELSLSSWLVGGLVPGLKRQPRRKLDPDPCGLLALLERWRDEGVRAGQKIERIAVAYEAGRDGFWLARWLRSRGIEAHVIHPNSIPVPREHRRAKSDRLDTELLLRGFLGWLRGEAKHCSMAQIPSIAQEDLKRPNREHQRLVNERTSLINRLKACLIRFGIRTFNPKLKKAAEQLSGLRTPEGGPLPANTLAELGRDLARLRLVREQIKAIETERCAHLAKASKDRHATTVRSLIRVVGLGVETADMLDSEMFARPLRDRWAAARYGGLTGSPDESGTRRREQGLARAGNSRVRRGMIQFAWRFLRFQEDSPLAQWYRHKTQSARKDIRKLMIVALARKLLIALWRMATQGVEPEGITLRQVG
ncbi:IS110 family transposase [Taklimakanibacter lacteus]|uniref:IS110 family transposase n=1 Tax=Taklimakanibacter lacteus TaxID=2268456 RepID=UPI000E6605B7